MDKFDEKKKMILEKIGKFKLYLLVTIVDRDRAKKVNEVLAEKSIKSQFLWFAEGTAKSEILDLLGLGSVDKAVMLNILPDNMVGELASSLSDKLKLEKPGKGIVFAIPLSGAGAPELQKINEDKWKKWQNEMEKEVEQMNINISHDLIVAVINQGDSEKLLTAARTAGARGGTMFHALKMGVGEAEKFFGISVQQKKDIVAIITKRENKESIMKAINQFCDGENKAVVFSLPVDNVFGIA